MDKLIVTVIIPTRNEEGCIGRVLKEIPRNIVDQVIIIDGHSSDGTLDEIKSHLKKDDICINQRGYGYGAAFLQGFKLARGEVIIMMDGDGSHDPKNIEKLIKKYNEGYNFVMGSRYIKGGRSNDDTILRFLGNKIFTWMTNLVHGTKIHDSLYLYTAISNKSLKTLRLKSTGFEFCTEILVKAHKAGLKIVEVPVTERARFAGESKVNSIWHGLKILKMILRKY
ncbi:MAG: glycosyltransferase family 2 protein [Candidatus Gottesmanbacteria bacterium]